jgi:hypothetical protein
MYRYIFLLVINQFKIKTVFLQKQHDNEERMQDCLHKLYHGLIIHENDNGMKINAVIQEKLCNNIEKMALVC